MTVRTWFRLQRAALWAHDTGTASDLDALANKVIAGAPIDKVESVYPIKLIFNYPEWEISYCLLERVRTQLGRAMWEMDQELRRREQLNYIAKDILQ